MTPSWKRSVEEWLTANGKDRAWLAREIGVEASTVKRLLEEQQSSSLVPRIAEVTGLPRPMTQVHSQAHEELIETIPRLFPEGVELVRAIVAQLPKKANTDNS
jgi:hypothetical protein